MFIHEIYTYIYMYIFILNKHIVDNIHVPSYGLIVSCRS